MWFIPFTFRDFVDILLVAVLIYLLYKSVRGTNALHILTGIITIYLLWVVVRALNMELLSIILGQVVSVGAIALVILFQPEIRRFLQIIGMRRKKLNFITKFFDEGKVQKNDDILPIIEAVDSLSRAHAGALFVLAHNSDLSLISEGGIVVDARLTARLLRSIFALNSPLNEGAVIISDSRITSAGCILPVTQTDVPESMGTRQRAALGLSEISDAVVIVISHTRGEISLARNGHLKRNLSTVELVRELNRFYQIEDTASAKDEIAL